MPTQMAPWEGATRNGAELHLAGVAVDDSRRVPDTPVPDGITFHPLEAVRLRRGQTWWVYRGLGRLIGRLDPDIVHVATEVYGLWYSQVGIGRRPVAGHTADNIWTFGPSLESRIRLGRARRVLSGLAGLASWNQAGIDLAHQHGLPPGTPTVVVPGRLSRSEPFEAARRDRARLRRAHGFGEECVFGYVGRFSAEKGGDWLIRAFAQSEAARHARLLFFGEGPMEAEWRSLAEDLGAPVTFAGFAAPETVPGVLAALDVLVVPSLVLPHKAEQFGRVIVESMFAGTPVVASRAGSIPEVVDDAGILVEVGDTQGLAAALASISQDASERRRLSRVGVESARRRYDADALGKNMVDFWARSLEASAGRFR